MKNLFVAVFMIFTTVAHAQQDKGSWYIGASSTSLGFDSKTNSENTIDVSFSGFKDTLNSITDSLNLAHVFPYSYELSQDSESKFDINLKGGYFLSDNFMFGLGFGYSSHSTLFKTNEDSELAAASLLTDSLTGVWFNNTFGSDPNAVNYYNHYLELYSLIAASADNELTHSTTMMTIAPFVRYYRQLRSGNALFIDASYTIGQGEESMKDASSSVSTTYKLSSSKINFGLGYEINLTGKLSLEPQFNYYMLDFESTLEEDTEHPILGTSSMGQRKTTNTEKGSGFNFSLGLSFYL